MKKIFGIIFCALGGCTIGFFANRLHTVYGCVLFALGIVLMVVSTLMLAKTNEKDE